MPFGARERAAHHHRIGAAGETPYWSAPSNNTNATSPLLNGASTIRFLQTAAVNPTSANRLS